MLEKNSKISTFLDARHAAFTCYKQTFLNLKKYGSELANSETFTG